MLFLFIFFFLHHSITKGRLFDSSQPSPVEAFLVSARILGLPAYLGLCCHVICLSKIKKSHFNLTPGSSWRNRRSLSTPKMCIFFVVTSTRLYHSNRQTKSTEARIEILRPNTRQPTNGSEAATASHFPLLPLLLLPDSLRE